MDVRTFMMARLPIYFKLHDTYKDYSGKGLLERYLDTLGDELQEDTVDKLEGLINQLDPETADSEYLSLLAYTVGNPPDIFGDIGVYRKFITQAINLYRYKGTKRGIEMLFRLLGYHVDIEILQPTIYGYDSGLRYDSEVRYDITKCNTHCLYYNLRYEGIKTNIEIDVFTDEFTQEFGMYLINGPLTPEQKALLIQFIEREFQPINVKLEGIFHKDEPDPGPGPDPDPDPDPTEPVSITSIEIESFK